jgi:hypothetical protein
MTELLERHGASGPHSFTVLLAEAAANLQGRDDRGVAEMNWRDFAYLSGIAPEDASRRLHELAGEPFGLIAIEAETTLSFRARLVRWAEWDQMPRDPTSAKRSREYRERQKVKSGEFDPATGEISAVTHRDEHTQDRTRTGTQLLEGDN